jgi:hypothetical protein
MEIIDQDGTTTQRKVYIGMMERNMHHHGLVKLLVLEELRKKNDTWEDFIARNQFGEVQKEEKEPEPEGVGTKCEEVEEKLEGEKKSLRRPKNNVKKSRNLKRNLRKQKGNQVRMKIMKSTLSSRKRTKNSRLSRA